jgi:NAD(P)-dependent dehydrogenase (short-subunit alcohol dehydrogenase family)
MTGEAGNREPVRESGPAADAMTVVTGAASGIGRAAAVLLGAAGHRVALLDRDAHAAEQVSSEVIAAGAPAAAAIACDVSDPASVDSALTTATAVLDALPTGLFTAAGIDIGGAAHQLSLQSWQAVLDVNLTGTFLTAQAVISRLLAAKRSGSIVLCSSPAASVAFSAGGASAYSASKGGVSALVRTLALECAPHGIRVNAIVPGSTDTPLMWANVAPSDRPRLREVINSEVPLGRLADPVEPARAAVWLLGRDSSYVTGSHLVCDGGVLAKAAVSF